MHRRLLIAAVPTLLAACAAREDGPADVSGDPDLETDPVEVRDTRIDTSLDTATDPDPEPDPPLGMCGATCGGSTLPCPEGAFCEYGVLDLMHLCTTDGCGLCAWIPDDCPPDGEPACGCDGEVYANACERRRERVQPDLSWTRCSPPEAEAPEPVPDAASD
jgi:hypothetical protein